MSVKAEMRDALLAMLRDTCGIPEATEVTEFHQVLATGGACSTCRWEEVRVLIHYDSDDGGGQYEWHGDMGALIRRLTDGQR